MARKESKIDYIDKEFHVRTLEEYHFMDIPKIMDICVLYGPTNKRLVSDMMQSLARDAPSIIQRFASAPSRVLSVLETVVRLHSKVLLLFSVLFLCQHFSLLLFRSAM